MIGGAALIADGMITPPISVTSAVEGLKNIPALSAIEDMTIIYIVLGILTVLFFCSNSELHPLEGSSDRSCWSGSPCSPYWASFILVMKWTVLHAFNPYYAIKLLTVYPKGFWILGAVFLCTTGAEALYSDLGHCGRKNIRNLLDIRKVLPDHQLSLARVPGCLTTGYCIRQYRSAQ